MKKKSLIIFLMLMVIVTILGCVEKSTRTIQYGEEQIDIPDNVKGIVYGRLGPDDLWVQMKISEKEYIRTIYFKGENEPVYLEGGIPGYTKYYSTDIGGQLHSTSDKIIAEKILINVVLVDEYMITRPPPDGEINWNHWFTYNVIDSVTFLTERDQELRNKYNKHQEMINDTQIFFNYPNEINIDHSSSIDKYGAGMFNKKNTAFNISLDCNWSIQNVHPEIRINENIGDKFSINLLELKKGQNNLSTTVYGTSPGYFTHGVYSFFLDYYISDWGNYAGRINIGTTKINVYLGVKT